jgi:hypothetical protein
LWDLLFRWDSNWYGRIAQQGYEYLPDKPSSVAFFPLYPICLRAVGAMTGAQVTLAGFLVSNTALVGAVILLRRLAALPVWGIDGLAVIRLAEAHSAAGCAHNGQLRPEVGILGQRFFQRPDHHVSYAMQALWVPLI